MEKEDIIRRAAVLENATRSINAFVEMKAKDLAIADGWHEWDFEGRPVPSKYHDAAFETMEWIALGSVLSLIRKERERLERFMEVSDNAPKEE